jgi:hypothetical protein
VPIVTEPTRALRVLSSLGTIVCGAALCCDRATRENQNEEITIYECVLASATDCRLQRDTSRSARTTGTAGTDWTTRRDGPVRRSGSRRRSGPARRPGPRRRSRAAGADWGPGPTRSGRTMSFRRASLHKPGWNSELRQGLGPDPGISQSGFTCRKQLGSDPPPIWRRDIVVSGGPGGPRFR